MKEVVSVIVSATLDDNGKAGLVLVGQKAPGLDVTIVNAFQGEEAEELWKKLSVKKY